MSKQLVEITGFPELQLKIKQLNDKVKRSELLKVLRVVSDPTLKAAKNLAPVSTEAHSRYTGVKKGIRRKRGSVPSGSITTYQPGNLKRSLGKIVAKRGNAKKNAVLVIGARSKGRKNDGYYAHMLVRKGFKGKKRKGSENDFLGEAYKQTKGQVSIDAEVKVAAKIQKIIDRLSR